MAAVAALQKEQEALQQQESQIQAQAANTTKDLQQIEQQLQQTVIRATADGTILSLNLRNSGQVVRPGDSLLQLAPINAPLIVKANASPQNIHKIKVGQVVKLKVTACPYPDYGTLDGVVSGVAADATAGATPAQPTAKGASQSYFEVSVKPTSMTFGPADTPCQLQSGMTATASIITEQDTALRFVLRKTRLLSDL
jgi:HlyD family secretion protein